MLTPHFRYLFFPVLLVLSFSGCTSSTPEETMKESVTTLIEVVEDKDFETLETYIHPDFVGGGQPDRASLLQWGKHMTSRYSHLNSAWTVESSQYYPESMRGTVVLKGGIAGHAGLLPKDLSRLIEVRIDLIFESDQWQVIGLEYQRK